MRARWIVVIGFVLLGSCGLVLWSSGSPEAEETFAVEQGDLVIDVPISGTIEAVDAARLGPPAIPNVWNFKLARLAPEGMQVKAGQPVMAFDTTELERTLLEKEAERDSAQTELERRRTELERERRQTELDLATARADLTRAELKADVPPDVSEGNELRKAKIDVALAQEQVRHLTEKLGFQERRAEAELAALREKRDRAAARVEEIREDVRRMTVTAPRDGTVIYVTNWRGEKKKVGDQVWQRETVLEIPNLAAMEGQGEVEEADAGRLAVGQPVRFRLDAHPDVQYEGTVASIERMVQRQSPQNPLKVVKLDVGLDDIDRQRMRPGMRFRGTVEVDRVDDVLLAPVEAIYSTPDGPVAYRRGGLGRVRAVPLEVGRRDDRSVEIEAGLEAGDLLVPRPDERAG